MPEPDEPRESEIESPRHTPFEHEVTAEPTEIRSAGVVEKKVVGVWTVRTGTVSRIPALPTWMAENRKKV